MLAHGLALSVALGSFSLYMSAFFFPEVYRKYDLTWSGVGMFYALVLWVCAGRITGGILLGQVASVTLIGWLGWQTLSLRREMTPPDQKTSLPASARSLAEAVRFKMREWISNLPQTIRTMPLPAGLNSSLARSADAIASLLSEVRNRVQPGAASKSESLPLKETLLTAMATVGDRLQNLTRRITRTQLPSSGRSAGTSTQDASVRRTSHPASKNFDSSFNGDDDEPIDAEFEPVLPYSLSRPPALNDESAHESAPDDASMSSDAIASPDSAPNDSSTSDRELL